VVATWIVPELNNRKFMLVFNGPNHLLIMVWSIGLHHFPPCLPVARRTKMSGLFEIASIEDRFNRRIP